MWQMIYCRAGDRQLFFSFFLLIVLEELLMEQLLINLAVTAIFSLTPGSTLPTKIRG